MVAVLEVGLSTFFTLTGGAKLIGHPHLRNEFKRFGYPYALAYLAGAMEVIGAALLAAGLWSPGLAALGSGVLLPVMLGATYTNFTKRPLPYGVGMLVIVALTAVPLWVHGGECLQYWSST